MKRIMLLVTCLFSIIILPAQGIYQLWGMTPAGGAGAGVIFSTDAAGNDFRLRHVFKVANPGATPQFTQLREYNGKFYGMTSKGGSAGNGVIFEWDPATNIYTKKKDFFGLDGMNPFGSLTLNGGKFYGMTSTGGSNQQGVIFEWDPVTNVYTKRFDFSFSTGITPRESLTWSGGKFYGATSNSLFEWDPVTNAFTVKVTLFGGLNGNSPTGDLVPYNGLLYGMTGRGGANDAGIIFEWDPVTNVYTRRLNFGGSLGDDGSPGGSLSIVDGKFYGALRGGVGIHGNGVIFEWSPSTSVYTRKVVFGGNSGNIGSNPSGSMMLNNGKFYGVTSGSGGGGQGVIYEWDPVTNVYTKKIDLVGANGGSPQGSLVFSAGKFYGLTSYGGEKDAGVIYEWDPVTNLYAKKVDLDVSPADGASPNTGITQFGSKLYGMTRLGGNNDKGVIFEFDPVTNTYSKKIDLSDSLGSGPNGNSLVLFGGKFYGMTTTGGSANRGVIFEWDPATNVYAKKIDLDIANGCIPHGNLTIYGDKFYGMTSAGGSNESGVIFEWDPVTNVYTKKIDFARYEGNPYGSLTFYAGKFYGMGSTSDTGGVNENGANFTGAGLIFEWDPVTNIFIKKKDLTTVNVDAPYGPQGNLALCSCSGKFYGVTPTGGLSGNGDIFEWNPVTNEYASLSDIGGLGSLTKSGVKFYFMNFSGIVEWDPVTGSRIVKKEWTAQNAMDGLNPSTGNDLTLVQVPVARGSRGSCENLPAVTIDHTNNKQWVAIVDDEGNAVAEIKANGNNLGIINASMFVNDAAVREDLSKRLYLDRNITLTPQTQPGSPVDIRLYIRGSEYQALKSAVNSIGQPSGFVSIDDMGIFKNENNSCPSALNEIANPVSSAVTDWRGDYVLSGSINSFSTFYFANRNLVVLPLTLTEFNGRVYNNNGLLNWKISNERNTAHIEVERSIDGRNYTVVGIVSSLNTAGVHNYSFTDPKITLLGAPVVYYRLKQNDLDGRSAYSRIIALSINNGNIVLFYPNPVKDMANLTVTVNKAQQLKLRIIDAGGKIMSQQQWKLSAGSTSMPVDVSWLAKGMYYLELKGSSINERKQFSKQ